jgi:hypothetical protein
MLSWRYYVAEYTEIVTIILAIITLIILTSLTSSCCTTGLRAHCCPICPPPTLIEVAKTCKLPPLIDLPLASRSESGCPQKMVCYDIENAKAIALRESRLKTWIREARAACQPPASAPASTPTAPPASRASVGVKP